MPREPDRLRGSTASERLEAFIDGELSAEESAELTREIETSEALSKELEQARQVRDALRGLPEVDASTVTLHRVVRRAESDSRWRAPGRRLALALAASLAIAALGLSAWRLLERPPQPDAAEVARAAAEARWVLARVDRLTRKAGATVREEVLAKYLVAPARQGVARSLGLDAGSLGPSKTPAQRVAEPAEGEIRNDV